MGNVFNVGVYDSFTQTIEVDPQDSLIASVLEEDPQDLSVVLWVELGGGYTMNEVESFLRVDGVD